MRQFSFSAQAKVFPNSIISQNGLQAIALAPY